MFKLEIFFLVVLTITFSIFVLFMCMVLAIALNRDYSNLSRGPRNQRREPKSQSNEDNPPNYENAITNPPDYSPREIDT